MHIKASHEPQCGGMEDGDLCLAIGGEILQAGFFFIRFCYRFLEYLKTQMDFQGVENVLNSLG